MLEQEAYKQFNADRVILVGNERKGSKEVFIFKQLKVVFTFRSSGINK